MYLHLVGLTSLANEHGSYAILATPFSYITDDGKWFSKHPTRLVRLRESSEEVEKSIGKFTLIMRATPTMSFHFPLDKSANAYLANVLRTNPAQDDESIFIALKNPIFEGLRDLLKRCPPNVDQRVRTLIGSLL